MLQLSNRAASRASATGPCQFLNRNVVWRDSTNSLQRNSNLDPTSSRRCADANSVVDKWRHDEVASASTPAAVSAAVVGVGYRVTVDTNCVTPRPYAVVPSNAAVDDVPASRVDFNHGRRLRRRRRLVNEHYSRHINTSVTVGLQSAAEFTNNITRKSSWRKGKQARDRQQCV